MDNGTMDNGTMDNGTMDNGTMDNGTMVNGTDEEASELNSTLLLVGYTPFIVVTVIGNLLVIIAYLRFDRVRSVPTNVIIFSLSISDFLVGLLVLTINLVWVYKGYWPFGELFCRVWSALDYTVTFTSTLAILLISFDRFLLVTTKSRYQVVWTRRRAIAATAAAWICSAILFTAIAFVKLDDSLVDFSEECELEFVYVVPFSIAQLIFEFAIPFPLIVITNVWVYFQIYKRSRNLGRKKRELNVHSVDLMKTALKSQTVPDEYQQSTSSKVLPNNNSAASDASVNPTYNANMHERAHLNPPNPPSGNVYGINSQRHLSPYVPPPQPSASSVVGIGREQQWASGREARKQQIDSLKQRQRQLSRHRKAAITLCVLVVTFVICWLPYEIVSIRQAMCGEDDCFSETVWEAVNGLLWCNSAMNPILYGLTNPQLRRHMLACFRRHRAVAPVV